MKALATGKNSDNEALRGNPVRLSLLALKGMLPAGSGWGQFLLGIGMVWMMLGMVVMPAGISYNPSRVYQITLVVLLYLPTLGLVVFYRGAAWRELWPLPAFRVFLLLLAWATLSLCWAQLHRPGDEFGRVLSVLLFVLGWHICTGHDPRYANRLLLLVGAGFGACALAYSIPFLLETSPADDRIVAGEGVMATSNYAAAAMGAVCIWLIQLAQQRPVYATIRWLAVCCLLVFIALTRTRSVWLGMATCALFAPLWYPGRWSKALAGLVLLAALAALLWPLPALLDRGTSYRPEIFQHALALIYAHPWLGLGQGASFIIDVGGQHLTHSHNVLTQAAIELGLPGLCITLAMWALVAWSGWRHRSQPLARVVLALWVYASVVLQFDLPQLLDSPRPGWLLIWLPFAIALGLEARTHGTRKRLSPGRLA